MQRTILSIVAVELVLIVLAYSQHIYTLEIIQACARYSGRFSLLIFSILFLAGRRPGNLAEYIFQKPYHAFALAHGIHLLEIILYITMSKKELNSTNLLGGFIGYIFLFTMPYLWEQYQQGKLSHKVFQITEKLFLYYIWLIFFLFYLPRVTGKIPSPDSSYYQYVMLLSWMSLLLGMKIIHLFSRQRQI